MHVLLYFVLALRCRLINYMEKNFKLLSPNKLSATGIEWNNINSVRGAVYSTVFNLINCN